MDGIRFADGFDTSDRLAFGLGAPQLLTVAAGSLLAFALIHLPLPGLVTIPAATAVALTAAGLGWVRIAGRPALEWALFAARFLLRPREGGLVLVSTSPPAAGHEPAVASGGQLSASNIVHLPFGDGRSTPNATTVPTSVSDSSGTPAGVCGHPGKPEGVCGHSGARRVVFFSLKGGTGRTTLSTEVAACLATGPRASAALIDCDLRTASIGGRLGLAGSGIVDYATAPPDDRRLDQFLALHASGLRVLLGPAQPANPAWPVTPAVLREVLRELDLFGATTVFVDVSPDLNDLTRAALRAADDVLVVVVPTSTGILDAYRTTQQLRRLGLRDRLGYVVNRSRGSLDVSVAMQDLGGDVIAEIPEDGALVDAENTHRPAVLENTSAASLELYRLAARVRPVSHAAAR